MASTMQKFNHLQKSETIKSRKKTIMKKPEDTVLVPRVSHTPQIETKKI